METNNFNSTYRKRIDVVQNIIEQKIEPEDNVNIGKILCVNAKAYLDNVEILNGEAYYSGEVVFDVLFTDEQGNIINQTLTSNLQGKIENDTLNANMLPIYKVEVVNVSIQNASASGLRASATVEITLDCLVSDEVCSFDLTNENIKVKQETVNVFTAKNSGSATFNVGEEIEIKGQVNKQLLKTATLSIKDVKSGTGYFTVEGDINFSMCYETGTDENKMIKCVNECLPFKEEIEVDDLTKEQTVEIIASLKPNDVVLTLQSEDETKTIYAFSATVGVKYFVLDKQEKDIVVDAYCTTHNLNLISESFNYTKLIQNICENKNIDCELSLQEDQPRVSKILFVCGENVNITNSYIADEKLLVEGIVNANVVYLNDEENEEICSVMVENPFKVELNEDVDFVENVFVKTTVKDCMCHVKKGKDLELEFNVGIMASVYSTGQESYLKEVELTEELAQNPYSMQIYFAPKDSSIWDISKQLRVSPDIITSQNPNLTFPLENPEQIVYFIQK